MNFVRKIAVISVIGLASALSTSVMAAEGAALLVGKPCVGCHKEDGKLVGPSYKDIAVKYKGDANAPENLVKKIKSGGAGAWGPIPMPPHPTMSDGDLKAIVTWILSLS